jgi:acyl-CoA synthetase (AMP-forming)/AMP-acid ligase II
LREISAERATVLYPSFPTITNALFEHPDFDARRLAHVRVVNNVGPPDLLRRHAATLPTATHVSAYGLTEAGGVVSFNDLDDSAEQLAETCGTPFDGVEVRVVDPETGDELPRGGCGELQIRGPTLFSGYYRDADRTRSVHAPGGWLRTGDLGALAEGGRIRYLGRIKDMLKVGGENVAAIEIESHLCTHPAIKVAQVIGVPDERLQEVPAAFVELHAGAALDAREVVHHCHGRIAGFKVPRYVYFVTDWPMSATKVQKFKLRELVRAADRIDLELTMKRVGERRRELDGALGRDVHGQLDDDRDPHVGRLRLVVRLVRHLGVRRRGRESGEHEREWQHATAQHL